MRGLKEVSRVGIEGDDGSDGALFFCGLADLAQETLVSPMDAVKVSNGYAGRLVGGELEVLSTDGEHFSMVALGKVSARGPVDSSK